MGVVLCTHTCVSLSGWCEQERGEGQVWVGLCLRVPTEMGVVLCVHTCQPVWLVWVRAGGRGIYRRLCLHVPTALLVCLLQMFTALLFEVMPLCVHLLMWSPFFKQCFISSHQSNFLSCIGNYILVTNPSPATSHYLFVITVFTDLLLCLQLLFYGNQFTLKAFNFLICCRVHLEIARDKVH